MKQQPQRLSMTQKFSFRRRAPVDGDEDLLSLRSADREALNPALHASSPKSYGFLTKPIESNSSLKRTRSTPLKPHRGVGVNRSLISPNHMDNAVYANSSISSKTETNTPRKQLFHSNDSVRSKGSGASKTRKRTTTAMPITTPEPSSPNSSTLGIAANSSTKSAQDCFNRTTQAAHALDNAGNEFFGMGNFTEALECYTKALKLKRRTLKFGVVAPDSQNAQQLLASVATSINNIGYLRQRAGANHEEIMAAYQDSLQIKIEILGDKDLSVGKTLNNIGSVYFGSRAYSDAMVAYTQAKAIMEHNLGLDHLDVATVHSNIGDVHLAQRQLVEAHENYAASLNIRWTALGEHHHKVKRLLEKLAAIEMSDTPQAMQQIEIIDDIEEKVETPVQQDLQELREQVKEDVTFVDGVQRKMALEMIRDKIQMIREMRELDGDSSIVDEDDHSSVYTQEERNEALCAVKKRVERIRQRKIRDSQRGRSASSADRKDSLMNQSMERLNLEGNVGKG